MKIYTSYFYQIRHFPQTLVPLSTALGDPAWFHANRDFSYKWKDKRGVLNGLRAPVFSPDPHYTDCQNCSMKGTGGLCPFLLKYRIQLNGLNYEEIMDHFKGLRDRICAKEGWNDCDFALIVHEAPTNPCSERGPLQQWFATHGCMVEEWYPTI